VLDLVGLIDSGLDWDMIKNLTDRYRIGEHVLLSLRIVQLYFPGKIPGGILNEISRMLPMRLKLLSRFQFITFRGIGRSRMVASYLFRILLPFFYRGSLASRICFSFSAIISPLRHIAIMGPMAKHGHV
jgi:hypothetical protein